VARHWFGAAHAAGQSYGVQVEPLVQVTSHEQAPLQSTEMGPQPPLLHSTTQASAPQLTALEQALRPVHRMVLAPLPWMLPWHAFIASQVRSKLSALPPSIEAPQAPMPSQSTLHVAASSQLILESQALLPTQDT